MYFSPHIENIGYFIPRGVFVPATIYILAAIDENNAIGHKNKLLCSIPEDLARFRTLTDDRPVIMGRKTYESLGCKPLPHRMNIVITSTPEKYERKGVIFATNLTQALKMAKKIDREMVFIIGGGEIYKQAMEEADVLLITHIKEKFKEADCYFPKISSRKWKKTKEEEIKESKNGIKYQQIQYEKKED